MRIRTLRSYTVLTGIIIVSCVMALGTAVFAGTFKDKSGVTHAWSVDATHALIWEGTAYVPFGTTFEPKYFADQTDENWNADEASIGAMKSAGVSDVILKPGKKGLTSISVEAFQKVIDMLDAKGIRYGINLNDPPYEPLTGYVIDPVANRVDGLNSSQDVTRKFADTKTVFYAVCDAKTAALRRSGQAIAINGEVTVPVNLRSNTDHVLLFYPQKVITSANADWGLPDLWSDYDRHRDRQVWFLSQIKFGPGLRFFADPLTESLGIRGDSDSLIPTSTAFRLQYSAWLSRKYGSPRDLGVAWRITGHEIASYTEAARLIPLWKDGRGIPMVYDPASDSKYRVDVDNSSFWEDFREFRTQSIRTYMDAMADVVKRLGADVPLIYTASGLHPIFQTTGTVGYNGLVVSGSGDASAVIESAGRAYSLVDNSNRQMWLLSSLKPTAESVGSKEALFGAMNNIRSLGAKGFFVENTEAAGNNLLAWLGEYASLNTSDQRMASYSPQVIYYPDGAERTKIKKLSGGAWWLPSLYPGKNLYLGSSLGGYTFIDPKTNTAGTYVWSVRGAQVLHFASQKPVTILRPSGESAELKPKKGRVEISIAEEPIKVVGIDASALLPLEGVAEALQELEKAIVRADLKKLETDGYKFNLRQAKELMDNNQLATAMDMARVSIHDINARLRGMESVPSADAKQ